MKIKLHSLIKDMPSEKYHSVKGTYSSSQLKDILDDEQLFYDKYISKTIERQSIPAFDIGTYFHTKVLEPHKLHLECAVFNGPMRRGEKWDQFVEDNKGKCLLTARERDKAEQLASAVFNSPIAASFIDNSEPEVSMFVKLAVDVENEKVYSPRHDCVMKFNLGWVKTKDDIDFQSMVPLIIKVRADGLGSDFVLDLKSTSGNTKNEHTVKQKISSYKYDLSAALYLDMFTAGTGQIYKNFAWIFASKDFNNSKTWMASPDNLLIGRAKWMKAIFLLAKNIKNNWQIKDELGILEPNFYEREYLKGAN